MTCISYRGELVWVNFCLKDLGSIFVWKSSKNSLLGPDSLKIVIPTIYSFVFLISSRDSVVQIGVGSRMSNLTRKIWKVESRKSKIVMFCRKSKNFVSKWPILDPQFQFVRTQFALKIFSIHSDLAIQEYWRKKKFIWKFPVPLQSVQSILSPLLLALLHENAWECMRSRELTQTLQRMGSEIWTNKSGILEVRSLERDWKKLMCDNWHSALKKDYEMSLRATVEKKFSNLVGVPLNKDDDFVGRSAWWQIATPGKSSWR